ncbi:hypothetical protein C7M84_003448 [Penaeus vannamei]|uniref:BPTI/Kunitz inhibitor domain-containing protein n=1 Tax=Penaeus vannamei TaxID=6689 RepID=A0A3R7QTL5_PENVA|nr:hypothetical protein C7M84_003448 [Penaeus vannamei]
MRVLVLLGLVAAASAWPDLGYQADAGEPTFYIPISPSPSTSPPSPLPPSKNPHSISPPLPSLPSPLSRLPHPSPSTLSPPFLPLKLTAPLFPSPSPRLPHPSPSSLSSPPPFPQTHALISLSPLLASSTLPLHPLPHHPTPSNSRPLLFPSLSPPPSPFPLHPLPPFLPPISRPSSSPSPSLRLLTLPLYPLPHHHLTPSNSRPLLFPSPLPPSLTLPPPASPPTTLPPQTHAPSSFPSHPFPPTSLPPQTYAPPLPLPSPRLPRPSPSHPLPPPYPLQTHALLSSPSTLSPPSPSCPLKLTPPSLPPPLPASLTLTPSSLPPQPPYPPNSRSLLFPPRSARISPECAVTQWTDWSPCTRTCGEGTMSRHRIPFAPSFEHCNVHTNDVKKCSERINCTIHPSEREEVCMQEKEEGPCRAVLKRFYYDVDHQQCRQFTYGGCRGNRNNFETYDECAMACEVKTRTPLPTRNSVADVDCQVSPWSEWTGCSKTCGKGWVSRTREILVFPQHEGRPCPKKLRRRRKCINPKCSK